MLVPILTLSLFGFLGGHGEARSDARTTKQVYGVERWRLEVKNDAFVGATTCRLRSASARVERGRLLWPLGPNVESAHAAYRIDQGPPHVQNPAVLPVSANLTNPQQWASCRAGIGDRRGSPTRGAAPPRRGGSATWCCGLGSGARGRFTAWLRGGAERAGGPTDQLIGCAPKSHAFVVIAGPAAAV